MTLTPEEQAEWSGNRQPLLYGVLSVLFALANIAVFLRLYVTLKRCGRLRVDDCCMAAALAMCDGVIASLIYATTQGFGLYAFRVVEEDDGRSTRLVHVLKTIWAYAVMNGTCFMTIKLAILLSYRRMFFGVKWFQIGWWFNLTYAALWTIGSTFFYIFQCQPVYYFWTRVENDLASSGSYTNTYGHCNASPTGIGAPVILNSVGDLMVLLLPAPILFELQVTNVQRIRLLVFFGMGSVTAIAGFVRFAEIFKATGDYSWNSVGFVIWSTVEQVVGIVCANIPMIYTYFEEDLHKRYSSRNSKSTRRQSILEYIVQDNDQRTARVSARVSTGSRHSRGSRGSRGVHSWFLSTGLPTQIIRTMIPENDSPSRSGSEASTVMDLGENTTEQITPADSWEKEELRRAQEQQLHEINVTRTFDVRSVSH